MTDQTTSDILNKAADLIDAYGWYQGDLIDQKNGYAMCAVGALAMAAGAKVRCRAVYIMTGGKGIDGPVKTFHYVNNFGTTLATWNDAPGRTKEEVTAALRRAAKNG